MADEVTKTSAVRSNLLELQGIDDLLRTTQERLSTGKKVNSALDDPQNFFSARTLSDRSEDLLNLKDQMGQGIQTIQAADTATNTMLELVDQARGLTDAALSNLGNDPESVGTRASLANDFNEVIRQIDDLTADADYGGKNLTVGNQARFGPNNASLEDTNQLPGVSNTRVTTAQGANQYRMQFTGGGAITGQQGDIADAQLERGISDLRIGGLHSESAGSFDDIAITVEGGEGADKRITVSEGDESSTITFDYDELTVKDGTFYHKFKSGTTIQFDINLAQLEGTPKTSGVGTSMIEKNVDLKVTASDIDGFETVRDGTAQAGSGKLSEGENALTFPDGTLRFDVDEQTIQQASFYQDTISQSYGSRGDVITNINLLDDSAGNPEDRIQDDRTFTLTSSVDTTAASFNAITGNWSEYQVTLTGSNGQSAVQTVSNSGTFTFADVLDDDTVGPDRSDVELELNYNKLIDLTSVAAATAGEIQTTFEPITGPVNTANELSVTSGSVSGFLEDYVTDLDFDIDVPSSAEGGLLSTVVTISDGVGGIDTRTVDLRGTGAANAAQTIAFTIQGGVNDGATISFDLAAGVIEADESSSLSYKIRGENEGTGSAAFDARNETDPNLETRKSVTTEQTKIGNNANDLRVDFNEERTNFIIVDSVNLTTDGTGLAVDQAENNWRDRADVEEAIADLDRAERILQSAGTTFSTNLAVIQNRDEYTDQFTNVLEEGADRLTLADENQEAANLSTLQTRQQLAINSLSIATQSQQAILNLF